MKTSTIFLLVFLILNLSSCDINESESCVNIKIINNTENKIELAFLTTIYNEGKTTDEEIEKKANQDFEFDFSGVSKTDGSYSLFLKYENSIDTLREDFGYYTNGYPLESKFLINIYTDSIIIESTSNDIDLY